MHCVGTGFIALDIIRSALDQSATLERRHVGGSCGNVLAILSYLGVNTSAVGRIGDDAAGGELLADLRRSKVDVNLLVVEQGRRTPIVIQQTYFDARGRSRHRFSRACPVCGAAMPGYRPLLVAEVSPLAAALPAHQLFFFDRVSSGTLALARHSQKQGALVVFEPSGIKDERLFVECLRVSHVLKYSRERLAGLDVLASRMRLPLEVETLGAGGLRFRLHKSMSVSAWNHLSALPAQSVRDSVGSGDWCTAGFLARIAAANAHPLASLENKNAVVDGLRFGQALAALNCSYDGARGLMYVLNRVGALKAARRLLANDVPRLPHVLSAPPRRPKSDRGCAVCDSDRHAAHA